MIEYNFFSQKKKTHLPINLNMGVPIHSIF